MYNSLCGGGFPQLKELDELAQKVGNIPTFTSSDKAALSELIENADALIALIPDTNDVQTETKKSK